MSILRKSVASVLSRVNAPKISIGPKTMSNLMKTKNKLSIAPPAKSILVNDMDTANWFTRFNPCREARLRLVKKLFKIPDGDDFVSSTAFASSLANNITVNDANNMATDLLFISYCLLVVNLT